MTLKLYIANTVQSLENLYIGRDYQYKIQDTFNEIRT